MNKQQVIQTVDDKQAKYLESEMRNEMHRWACPLLEATTKRRFASWKLWNNALNVIREEEQAQQAAKNSMNMFGPKRVVYVQGLDGEPLTDRDFFGNEEAR